METSSCIGFKMIKFVVWSALCCLLLLSEDVICDKIDQQFFAKNLNDVRPASQDAEFGKESEAAAIRVVRASPVGWVSLSTYTASLPEDASITVRCMSDTDDLNWLDPSAKKIDKKSGSLSVKYDKKLKSVDMQFSPVKSKHKGIYICVNKKYNKSANFTLTVLSKPKVKISSDSTVFEAGDDFNITCKTNYPTATWKNSAGVQFPTFKTGSNLVYSIFDSNQKVTTLVFRNVSTAHAGDYVCYLNVSGYQVSEKISIKVNSAMLQFSPDIHEMTVKENEEFGVTCKGKVSSVSWTHEGKEMKQNHQEDENVYVKGTKVFGRVLEQTLRFENVEKSNEGKYFCSGYSTYDGSHMQRVFKLKVKEDNTMNEPIIRTRTVPLVGRIAKVFANSPFGAVCIGDTENIQWLGPPYEWQISERNDTSSSVYTQRIPLFKKKMLLKFRNVSVENEGKYICRVTKRGSVVSNEFNLTVIIPASYNATPSSYSVTETSDIKLECVVNGRPKPEVTWYLNGKPIVNETHSSLHYEMDSLIIKNISFKNAGKYICKAVQPINDGFTIEKAVHLEVFHKPYFPQGNVSVEKIENSTAVIECNCVANPPALYTWNKNDSIVIDSSGVLASDLPKNTIEISLKNYLNFGEYICTAKNQYGVNAQSVNVTIMGLPETPEVGVLGTTEEQVNFFIKTYRNATITSFNIEFREISDKYWSVKNDTKGESWSHIYFINDLSQKAKYFMRVRSVNPVGLSNFSAEVSFETMKISSFASQLTASMGLLSVIFFIFYFSLY